MQDITNQKFGRLVALKPVGRNSDNRVVWLCKCDCKNYKNVAINKLKCGDIQSCGCLRRQNSKKLIKYLHKEQKGKPLNNLVGQKFNKLLVKQLITNLDGCVTWSCLCDCGKRTTVTTSNLTTNHTKSCGCWDIFVGTQRMRELALKQIGPKHPNWRFDLTDEERIKRRGNLFKKWSNTILYLDNYTCRKRSKRGGNLEAHHIFNWAHYLDRRYDLNNGATLCEECHTEFHSEFGYGSNTLEQFEEFLSSRLAVANA